jgi:hypothetical protein
MTAQEAKDKGFIDKVVTAQKFSNYIDPSAWMYKDTAVLNAYNSHVENNNSSNEKNMIDKIIEGVSNALKTLGIVNTAGDGKAIPPITNEALTAALTESLKPVTDQVQTIVNSAVDAKVANINETITNAVVAAVKPLQDELKAVKDDIANSATPAAAGQNNAEKSPFDHAGIGWN